MAPNKPTQKIVTSRSAARRGSAKGGSKATLAEDSAPSNHTNTTTQRITFKRLVPEDFSTANRPTDNFTTEPPTTSRSGRALKAKRHDANNLYGSDLEAVFQANENNGIIDKLNDDEDVYVPSSPPTVYQAPLVTAAPKTRGKSVRHSQQASQDPAPRKLDDEIPSDETVREETSLDHRAGSFPATIDSSIYQLADILAETSEVQLDLPNLQDDANPEVEQPWTFKQLAHLYILCWHNRQYHHCDLIVDTWIRAFQKLHRNHRMRIWRPNRHQYENQEAPQWYLDVQDPVLSHDVTDFDQNRINELYHHTPKNCGVRMLMADAMALCGDRIEDHMENMVKKEGMWHPDVIFDIMCTSLRMVRRKLTLKIEEMTEGAWCNRYHEHRKNGLKCYREIAHGEKETARKHRLEKGEDWVDVESPNKRVRFDNNEFGGSGEQYGESSEEE